MAVPLAVLSWQAEAVVRLLVAAAMGGAIGLEREQHGRSAGFRTQLLVALGSALAMVVSLHFAQQYGSVSAATALRIDPARVAYGIMGGIGFLGAGAIIRHGTGVRGMTTAASLWCTAAVGMACGFGMYLTAVAATLIVIFALLVLEKVEEMFPSRRLGTAVVIASPPDRELAKRVRQALAAAGAKPSEMQYDTDLAAGTDRVTAAFSISHRVDLAALQAALQQLPGVTRVSLG